MKYPQVVVLLLLLFWGGRNFLHKKHRNKGQSTFRKPKLMMWILWESFTTLNRKWHLFHQAFFLLSFSFLLLRFALRTITVLGTGLLPGFAHPVFDIQQYTRLWEINATRFSLITLRCMHSFPSFEKGWADWMNRRFTCVVLGRYAILVGLVTCSTPSCLWRGIGGDREPRRWWWVDA